VHYALPSKDASYDAQIESIDSLPDMQTPEVLGLHSNADVAHSTRAAKSLWSNVLSLQSKLVAAVPVSATSTQKNNTGTDVETNNENSVLMNIVIEILSVVTNDAYAFDVAKIQRQIITESSETPSPTTVVLFQELERHNALKDVLKHSLRELVKALSGEIGMSPELDAISDALSRGRVPDKWKSAAPPTDKDVQSWIAWYKRREKQFKSWSTRGEPKVMWLSGLHCPETYIAALIQSACRLKGWPLDASAMYTEVTEFTREDEILAKPELGCYITGLFLEGASWDHHNQCLASQHDKVLVSELPILRLVPTQTTAQSQSSTSASSSKAFKCPVYFTQNRRDAMGRGLVFEADLASVDHPALWTLQGVALCLNTDF
jgi:dynein heavy chain, axonemal